MVKTFATVKVAPMAGADIRSGLGSRTRAAFPVGKTETRTDETYC